MDERVASVLAEAADAEPYEPRYELASDELRSLYRTEAQTTRRGEARPGLWMAVAIYVLFSATDLLLIPDVAAYTITARFAVGLTALLILEMQLRRGVGTEWLDVTCAVPLSLAMSAGLSPAVMGADKESVFLLYGLRHHLHDECQSLLHV